MDYQHYNIEDFLMDSSFRNYCLGNKEKDVLFWYSWIAANSDKDEEIQQAKQLFILLNGNNTANRFKQNKQVFQKALNNHLHEEKHSNNIYFVSGNDNTCHKKSIALKILYAGSAAASLLLIAISFYFMFDRQKATKGSNVVTFATLPLQNY